MAVRHRYQLHERLRLIDTLDHFEPLLGEVTALHDGQIEVEFLQPNHPTQHLSFDEATGYESGRPPALARWRVEALN